MDKAWRRRKKIDLTPLKRIVILMTVNDEFLRNVIPIFDDVSCLPNAPHLLQVIRWSISHSNRYRRAPREYIDTLFKKFKDEAGGEDEAEVKLLASFLSKLNEEYLRGDYEDIDINYELEVAEKLIRSYSLVKNSNDIIAAVKANATEEAVEIRKSFTLPGLKEIERPPSEIMEKKMITSDELSKKDIDDLPKIIDPWLSDGSVTMLYGPRGMGKTWICLIIAISVTRQNPASTRIGPWRVVGPAGALYIDGEMNEYHLQQRLKSFEGKDTEKENHYNPLVILSASTVAKKYRQQISIGKQEWRESIYDYLAMNDNIQLIILDNIASLTMGLDENDKKAWDPINEWILSLRHLGVAVLFVHHAGKGGQQRGTSGREDNVDNIIKLKKGYEEGGKYDSTAIYIDISFEKARNIDSSQARKFGLKIFENRRQRRFGWEEYDIKKKED
jgi:KaiC/GvpD/RAD55 family RecA-like ATPase